MKSTCVLCVYTVCITHNEEKNPFSRQQSIQNLFNSINVYLRRTQCSLFFRLVKKERKKTVKIINGFMNRKLTKILIIRYFIRFVSVDVSMRVYLSMSIYRIQRVLSIILYTFSRINPQFC